MEHLSTYVNYTENYLKPYTRYCYYAILTLRVKANEMEDRKIFLRFPWFTRDNVANEAFHGIFRIMLYRVCSNKGRRNGNVTLESFEIKLCL